MVPVALQNMMILLGAIQIARKIPCNNPTVLNYVRLCYVLVEVLTIGTYFFVSYKIKQKNDRTTLKYVVPPHPMVMLRAVADPFYWSPDSVGLITTTIRDYDLSETSQLLRRAYFGIAVMAFLHLYMKYNQILFIQVLVGLKELYDKHVVAIHVLGKAAEDDLKRPFKLGLLFDPTADPAIIAEAEERIRTATEHMARVRFRIEE